MVRAGYAKGRPCAAWVVRSVKWLITTMELAIVKLTKLSPRLVPRVSSKEMRDTGAPDNEAATIAELVSQTSEHLIIRCQWFQSSLNEPTLNEPTHNGQYELDDHKRVECSRWWGATPSSDSAHKPLLSLASQCRRS
jgi:hypothetical protein